MNGALGDKYRHLIGVRGNRLSVPVRGRRYVIGFHDPVVARNVLHSLHPDPVTTILHGERAVVDRRPQVPAPLGVEAGATVFIPKAPRLAWSGRGTVHPLNDAGHFLDTVSDVRFYNMVFGLGGIVLPYELVTEDDDEFVFRCCIVEELDLGRFK